MDAQATTTPAPAAAPAAAAPAPAAGGPIDNNDIQFWSNKVNQVLARPADTLNSKSEATAPSWVTSFFGCFEPVDLCLVTWCLPCVTFGKTHHQLHKDANLVGYEPVNTSCLLFCGSGCCGCWWVPTVLQRHDIREKFGLQGSFLVDLAAACCCGCCSLVQQNKEVAHRAPAAGAITTGYENQTEMSYPSK